MRAFRPSLLNSFPSYMTQNVFLVLIHKSCCYICVCCFCYHFRFNDGERDFECLYLPQLSENNLIKLNQTWISLLWRSESKSSESSLSVMCGLGTISDLGSVLNSDHRPSCWWATVLLGHIARLAAASCRDWEWTAEKHVITQITVS